RRWPRGRPGSAIRVLAARTRGEDAVFIYNFAARSDFGITVPAESPVQTPEDLCGKVVGTGTAGRAGGGFARKAVQAREGVDPTLNKGSFTAVIGSSGCGKSTLLKFMAGLIPPSTGRVAPQGRPVTGPRRDIGMMFQQATLFSWRTTVEDIVLPIEIRDGK